MYNCILSQLSSRLRSAGPASLQALLPCLAQLEQPTVCHVWGPLRTKPQRLSRQGLVLRKTTKAHCPGIMVVCRGFEHQMPTASISRPKCRKCRKCHLLPLRKSRNGRSREKTVFHGKKRSFTPISRGFHAVSRCFTRFSPPRNFEKKKHFARKQGVNHGNSVPITLFSPGQVRYAFGIHEQHRVESHAGLASAAWMNWDDSAASWNSRCAQTPQAAYRLEALQPQVSCHVPLRLEFILHRMKLS